MTKLDTKSKELGKLIRLEYWNRKTQQLSITILLQQLYKMIQLLTYCTEFLGTLIESLDFKVSQLRKSAANLATSLVTLREKACGPLVPAVRSSTSCCRLSGFLIHCMQWL